MKPLIGITPSLKDDSHFGELFTMAATYVNAVATAGGVPLVLPPHQADIGALLDGLDGLLLSGGGDIRPDRFGDETVHPTTYGVSDLRDDFEFALLAEALRRDLPLLAICRGIQVLNVGLGGTLYQDVADLYADAIPHRQEVTPETRHEPSHPVTAEPGSLLAAVYETTTIQANSFHHQAVKEPGEGLVVVGRTDDGTIEALELPNRRFVLGVQWHPEMMFAAHREHLRPFTRLVEEASAYKTARQLAVAAG